MYCAVYIQPDKLEFVGFLLFCYNPLIIMDLSQVLSDTKEKISGILTAIRAGIFSVKPPSMKLQKSNFSDLGEKITSTGDAFLHRFRAFVADRIQLIPETIRRPFIIGIGALAVIIVFLIFVLIINTGKKEKNSANVVTMGISIPSEELFIPAEPDFIPKFLLEREPRRYWTLEEIRPYWKAPRNIERWKEEIKSAVDKLMEGVP